ncbi:unnamed protein product [Cuscuta europaea]|uniref:Uncharacterized protein n=1 Tax=Cuscuta europaea TaxID=41803 RepID=A0A9P1EIL6_CUSEU|nr:unnamed protein product [Cuscuta europaea]
MLPSRYTARRVDYDCANDEGVYAVTTEDSSQSPSLQQDDNPNPWIEVGRRPIFSRLGDRSMANQRLSVNIWGINRANSSILDIPRQQQQQQPGRRTPERVPAFERLGGNHSPRFAPPPPPPHHQQMPSTPRQQHASPLRQQQHQQPLRQPKLSPPRRQVESSPRRQR